MYVTLNAPEMLYKNKCRYYVGFGFWLNISPQNNIVHFLIVFKCQFYSSLHLWLMIDSFLD